MIPWPQNFHFVTTVPLTRTGVLYPRVRDFFIFIFDAILVRFRLSITFLSDINPANTLARSSLLVRGAWGCCTCTLITAWLCEEDSLSEEDVSSPLLMTDVFNVRDWTMSCNSATRLAFSFFTFFFLNLRFFLSSDVFFTGSGWACWGLVLQTWDLWPYLPQCWHLPQQSEARCPLNLHSVQTFFLISGLLIIGFTEMEMLQLKKSLSWEL